MKAYLAWPVRLSGRVEEFHITAKYLGTIEQLPYVNMNCAEPDPVGDVLDEVLKRIRPHHLPGIIDLSGCVWMPTKFNPVTHVLVLSGLNGIYYDKQARLASMRPDDYPEWRPHITVPKDLWTEIKKRHATLSAVVESTGPLTLYVDKKAVHEF